MQKQVVVVGGSLAGLRTIETLRAEGFDGRIHWVGEEPHRPYDRPPLSKEFLRGEIQENGLALRRDGYASLEVEPHFGQRARTLSIAPREIELEDGARLSFDALVIATGARARPLERAGSLAGVYLLRTLDDARAIRAGLSSRPRVCIIGGGFIGTEVAASCRQLGLAVSVIEPCAGPCLHALGPELADYLAQLHRDEGVDVRCGVHLAALDGARRVERVQLTDGSVIEADLVVVGIGATPAVDWLQGSALELADGVVCDATCATRVPGVYAAGDVACAYHPLYGRHVRIGHWTHASDQAVTAARSVLRGADAAPLSTVPLIWSDQFGLRLQVVGLLDPRAELRMIEGDLRGRRFAAAFVASGRIVGAVTCDEPRRAIQLRQLAARGGTLDELSD